MSVHFVIYVRDTLGPGVTTAASILTLITVCRIIGQAMVSVSAVLHGLAWGPRGPLMIATRNDYVSRRAFAMVMGYSSLILMVGSVENPLGISFMRMHDMSND